MYRVTLVDEARAVVAVLPDDALKALTDLLSLLSIEPYTGRLYAGPGTDLRTLATADGRLLAIWLVLDDQQRVEILRLLWLGNSTDDPAWP